MFMLSPQSPQPPQTTQPVVGSTESRSRTGSGGTGSGGTQAAMLIGRHVKINRGGPDSVEGVLLAVNGEVLVLSSQGTVIYVAGRHVKSITEEGEGGKKSGGGKSRGRSHGTSGSRSFITTSSFNSVLSQLRHSFVQINRGGPEKLDGFLAEIFGDSILLVVGRQRVRIPILHIKTVNVATAQNQNNQSNQNQQSGSSQSGGSSRSDGRSRNSQSSTGSGNRSRGSSSSGGRSRHKSRNKNRSWSGRRNRS